MAHRLPAHTDIETEECQSVIEEIVRMKMNQNQKNANMTVQREGNNDMRKDKSVN